MTFDDHAALMGSGKAGMELMGQWAPAVQLVAIFAVMTWKYFGFHLILYVAGLQQIPHEIEDAARIDGANSWQLLQRITVPLLGSTIRISVFVSVIYS